MYYQPTQISYEHYHFTIMTAPDQKSMRNYVRDLKKNKVKILVKSCETEYSGDMLVKEGIELQELIFEDGRLPSKDVTKRWLEIVDDFFDPEGGETEREETDAAASPLT